MKTCPHCQFLVADGATECSVCHQPVGMPAQPAGPWGAEPAPADATASTGGWAPVTSGEPGSAAPAPGASAWVPPAPVAPTSAGRPGVIIALSVALGLAVVVLMGLVAVTFIGRKVEPSAAAPPADWKVDADPAGRYRIEFPGTPVTRSRKEDAGLSAPIETVTAEVARRQWDSFLVMVDLPADPGGIDVSPQAMQERIIDGIRNEGSVRNLVTSTPRESTIASGPVVDVDFTFTSDGVDRDGRLRVLKVGADAYALVTIGPSAQATAVDAMHQRVIDSFRAPVPA